MSSSKSIRDFKRSLPLRAHLKALPGVTEIFSYCVSQGETKGRGLSVWSAPLNWMSSLLTPSATPLNEQERKILRIWSIKKKWRSPMCSLFSIEKWAESIVRSPPPRPALPGSSNCLHTASSPLTARANTFQRASLRQEGKEAILCAPGNFSLGGGEGGGDQGGGGAAWMNRLAGL